VACRGAGRQIALVTRLLLSLCLIAAVLAACSKGTGGEQGVTIDLAKGGDDAASLPRIMG
jgi:hypothetical protein